MIIDLHAHTSNSRMHHLHVERANIEVLTALAEKYEISKIMLMATYFPFKGTGLFNEQLLKRIEDKPLFGMFGSLDAMNNFEAGFAELRNLAYSGKLDGIKLYPGYQDFDPSGDIIFEIYRLADELNLPVMSHGGELHGCCPRHQREQGIYRCKAERCPLFDLQDLAQPKQLIGALRRFPHVKFVVSHLANPYFEELRQLMTEFPNVYTDISGQWVTGSEEDTSEYHRIITEEIKAFLAVPQGIDRVVFATDFPIQSYEDSIGIVQSLGLGPADQEKIFSANALRILDQNEEV
jgi:predicted TIM-barrel fold metal-dependent hydrolase